MAYSGFLLKVGDYEFPLKLIEAKSYAVKKNIQDLDSYRDADGVLHRNALEHYVITVSFTTKPNITSKQIKDIMSNIQKNYITEIEKKVLVTAYVPEVDDYITQEMYMTDILFTIRSISDIIRYDRVTFEFIGY